MMRGALLLACAVLIARPTPAAALADGARQEEIRAVHDLIGEGSLPAADRRLAPLLAAFPQDARVLNEHGRLLFGRGRYAEAVRAFSAAAAADPKFSDAAYNQGVALQQVGKLVEAREALARALALDPKFLKALNALASIEARDRRFDEARRHLEAARRIAPDDFDTWYNLGGVAADEEKAEEAVLAYRKAAALRPAHAGVRNNLGRTLLRMKRTAEAHEELAEAIRLDPALPEPRFNLGVLHEEARRLDEAEAAFLKTLELAPAFAEAAFRLGNISLARSQEAAQRRDAGTADGQVEAARGWYAKAVAANRDYPEARYNLALTLLQLKRPSDAAEQARGLVKRSPRSPQYQFLLGTALAQAGRPADAERAFRASVKLDPGCADCALRLANLLFQQNRLAESAKVYRDLIRADAANADAHFLLGLSLFRQGELKGARREFERTLELKPGHLDSLTHAATAALRLRQFKDAASFIGQAVDKDPAYVPVFRVAELLYTQASEVTIAGSERTVRLLTRYAAGARQLAKDPAKAHAAFSEMAAVEPACAVAHLKMGVLDVLNGKNQEGVRHLEEAERLFPGDAECAYALGSGWYNLGEADPRGEASPHFRKSVEAFRRAVGANPGHADAHWGLGSALFRMGQYREARAALETALRLNPFFAEGYNTLGGVLIREAELATDPPKATALREQAVQVYSQAVRANPGSESAHYNLGVAYHQLGKWKEAEASYETALRLTPGFQLALYRLARVYVDRKGWFDRGRAEKVFARLFAVAPDNCEYRFDYGAYQFNGRRFERAKEEWRRVLQRCPDHQGARRGMEQLLERGY